ncbi:DHH family phosphoesterase [Natronogracilivirga saccharolytica]|uniref:Bifunctional oligoribonuclease/PAP phosphatase NrnA n=1 Tax=Natronogracilivirga saccharolytica TaxID=2812953 RepID=A0A8J7RJD6_9BACT|nr:bifunctional oligoribonuclease/PAP phosphatase NrnA [Natronogracilivirga saccharolytica]MBP3192835.1 bifunctional oligoribonuclease/PAP phosphatase NrnA [Natronogracilivirga saccharolytica]
MYKTFAQTLASLKKPGLITHISPDGDAIGSQLALYFWFRKQGIEARMFNDDPVPDNLTWLTHQEKITVPEKEKLDECDAFVFIDGNHPSRFGNMSDYFEKTDKPIYLIDHHLDPPENFFAGHCWNPEASSTAYLVFKLFTAVDRSLINKEVAEALYTGIVTDTGSFRFDSVTAETHSAISEIISLGKIKPSDVYEQIYDSKSLSQYHLLGLTLNNISLYCNDRLAVTYVTEKMLRDTGCSQDDIEGFVNYALSINGVWVSLLLYEREDRYKISFRGKSRIDLNKVARDFQGGGHFNAAGGWHGGPLDKSIDDLIDYFSPLIRDKENPEN